MNSNGDWTLKVNERVYKTLAKFPRKDGVRFARIIEELPLNPYRGDIEKMEGEEHAWRRRVGAYRIFYEIFVEKKALYVFRIERRSSKTY